MDAKPSLQDLIDDYLEMKRQNLAPCMANMNPVFKKYIHKTLLTVSYPVMDSYLNPRKTMQGGLITAAFDNTFGALSYYSTEKKFMTTINMHTHYHYPIYRGDSLTVTVHMASLGKTIVSMKGEAVDSNGRLIATSGTDVMIIDPGIKSEN